MGGGDYDLTGADDDIALGSPDDGSGVRPLRKTTGDGHDDRDDDDKTHHSSHDHGNPVKTVITQKGVNTVGTR